MNASRYRVFVTVLLAIHVSAADSAEGEPCVWATAAIALEPHLERERRRRRAAAVQQQPPLCQPPHLRGIEAEVV